MASYTIVKQAEQPGFLRGLAKGIPQGASTFTNTLLPAILKQDTKRAEKEEKSAAIAALEDEGFERESVTIDGVKLKKKESAKNTFLEDPGKAIKEAIMKIQDPQDIAKAAGVRPPDPLSPAVKSQLPVAALTGISSSGKTFENTAIDTLRSRFAGGASDEVIGRDLLGLPQAPAVKATVPQSFTNEIAALKETSGGDVDIFVSEIESLKLKYVDNPEVLKRIKLILETIHK